LIANWSFTLSYTFLLTLGEREKGGGGGKKGRRKRG